GLHIRRWRLSSAATRWGSCSSDGNIMLNWRLIHFEPDIIDYVIAHEIAHLREMNHSKDFWREVGLILPGFERARDALRQHAPGSLPLICRPRAVRLLNHQGDFDAFTAHYASRGRPGSLARLLYRRARHETAAPQRLPRRQVHAGLRGLPGRKRRRRHRTDPQLGHRYLRPRQRLWPYRARSRRRLRSL